jgi:hypothetical protein
MNGRTGDGVRLAVLLVFAAGMRCWLLTHTEVPARDCVDFVRSAVRFEDRPWAEVMRTTHQMPGYPLLILAATKTASACGFEMTPERYGMTAQLVSSVAALITILPMYFAGRRLFGANAGFFAVLLFNALPVCVRVTSDGLSEGVFFLFAATALYSAVRGLQQSSSLTFVACGVASGLAYLTRPEGVELALAAGAAMLVAGVVKRSWRLPLKAGLALALGLAPLIGTYVATTGSFTRKPTSVQMLQPEAVARATSGPPIAAFLSDETGIDSPRGIWAARSVLAESLRACHFFGLVLAAVAIWLFRDRLRHEPALWLILVLPALHALVLWRMASVVGYVSERHAMIVAIAACFWVGGLLARVPRGTWVCAVVLVAIGLPSALKPLHANRAGHHAAGQWLASHAGRHDEVIDPFAWAYFYSGHLFGEGKIAPAAPEKRIRYVVMEQGSNEHARLGWTMNMARELVPRGEPVYRWPEHVEADKAQVVVYRLKPGQ